MKLLGLTMVALCIFATACGGDGMDTTTSTTGGDGDGDSGPASFAVDIQPIFTSKCAFCGCHGAGEPRVNLNEGAAYANLVDQTSSCNSILFVASGSSTTSFLINKLEGTQKCGSRMPLGGTLSAPEIARIAQWIDEGAADN